MPFQFFQFTEKGRRNQTQSADKMFCFAHNRQFQKSKNSEYYRITEWLGLKESSRGCLVTLPAKAQSPEAGLQTRQILITPEKIPHFLILFAAVSHCALLRTSWCKEHHGSGTNNWWTWAGTSPTGQAMTSVLGCILSGK